MLCTSCITTDKLWRYNNPKSPNIIAASEITEAELIQSGTKYNKCDIADYHAYAIEKSFWEKAEDRTVLVICTPITISIDIVLCWFRATAGTLK